MLRYTTIEWGYHNNSTLLLSSLMNISAMGKRKVIITYGKDAEFDTPNCDHWYVINISRHGKEYKGFVNSYWRK